MSEANMNGIDDEVMREMLGLLLMHGDPMPEGTIELSRWIEAHPGYWTEAYSLGLVRWSGTWDSVFVTDEGKAFFEGGEA